MWTAYPLLVVCSADAQPRIDDQHPWACRIDAHEKQLVVDSRLDEPVWQREKCKLSRFVSPWSDGNPPATTFRAAYDNHNLYFSFVVVDPDIVAVDDFAGERDVDDEDRVEVFFAPYPIDIPHTPEAYKLPPYYGFEIDPLGRVHDYEAHFYRHLNSDWDSSTLDVSARITEDGYVVEASISLSELESMGVFVESQATACVGLFRGQFSSTDDGESQVNWITWKNPGTSIPDFHLYNAFGLIQFE